MIRLKSPLSLRVWSEGYNADQNSLHLEDLLRPLSISFELGVPREVMITNWLSESCNRGYHGSKSQTTFKVFQGADGC